MSVEPEARVNLGKGAPALYRGVVSLDEETAKLLAAAGIATGFAHLIRFRVSQLNHCAFCLRMHAKDARDAGERQERLDVLPAWRETTYFDARERAALALVEAVTLVADGQVPDEVYTASAAVLRPDEIAALEWLAIVMNVWNRVAIASRYPVGPRGGG